MGEDETETCPLIICFLTEFIGIAIMMYFGCMGCLWDFEIGPTIPAFAFGFSILAVIQIFAHITPVHINPAISMAIFIMGKMEWQQFLVYVLAQYTGSLVGMYLLKITMPHAPRLCVLHVNMHVTEPEGFFIEFAAAFVLLLTVAGTLDARNENLHDSTPARIGLVIVGLIFATAPFTGGGLNPARAVSPAIIYNVWEEHWLYHSAPYAGMSTAAILYRSVFDPIIHIHHLIQGSLHGHRYSI